MEESDLIYIFYMTTLKNNFKRYSRLPAAKKPSFPNKRNSILLLQEQFTNLSLCQSNLIVPNIKMFLK